MADVDPRMMKVSPRIRYNTIGGVNGPLVILENVRCSRNRECGTKLMQIVDRSNSQSTMKLCP